MSTRLQIVMSSKELDEIRTAAERRRMTVSAWVRLVLREERGRTARGHLAVVRERGGAYGKEPAGPTPRVRLEVDVKEDLLEAVRERYHLSSQRATVEFALRRAAVRPMSKEEALAMEGVGWDGDLGAMRSGDPGEPW
jgi:Arc/MetJ family transcription regulator